MFKVIRKKTYEAEQQLIADRIKTWEIMFNKLQKYVEGILSQLVQRSLETNGWIMDDSVRFIIEVPKELLDSHNVEGDKAIGKLEVRKAILKEVANRLDEYLDT